MEMVNKIKLNIMCTTFNIIAPGFHKKSLPLYLCFDVEFYISTHFIADSLQTLFFILQFLRQDWSHFQRKANTVDDVMI